VASGEIEAIDLLAGLVSFASYPLSPVRCYEAGRGYRGEADFHESGHFGPWLRCVLLPSASANLAFNRSVIFRGAFGSLAPSLNSVLS
jgi:hypothetical protein